MDPSENSLNGIDYDKIQLPDPDKPKDPEPVDPPVDPQSPDPADPPAPDPENIPADPTDPPADPQSPVDPPSEPPAPEPEPVVQEKVFDVHEFSEGSIESLDDLQRVSDAMKDPFFKKAFDYFSREGTLQPFLEAHRHDYNSMSDVDLLRMEWNQANDFNSEEDREAAEYLFEKEVLSKYDVDEDADDREKKAAQMLKSRDASRAREKFIASQEEFTAPAREEQSGPTESEVLEATNKLRRSLANDLEKVVSENSINVEIKEGVDALSVPIDPSVVIDSVLNPKGWLQNQVIGDDKSLNLAKLSKIIAFAKDPEGYAANIFDQGEEYWKSQFVDQELKLKPENGGAPQINSGGEGSKNPYSLEAFAKAKLKN